MRLASDDAKALGAALRARREEIGMSRSALSRLIGRDPATIQAYEAGGKKTYGAWIVASPSDTMLTCIAEALRTTREALCEASGLSEATETDGADAMAAAATDVRAVNAALAGVTIRGAAEDVAALLALALERGLMSRLHFSPVHA